MAAAQIRAVLPLAATLAAIRDAAAAVIVLVVGDDLPSVERAMLIAAIAPLAIECAPGRRLCAIDLKPTADPLDIAAAIAFLTGAGSTTGQVLTIG